LAAHVVQQLVTCFWPTVFREVGGAAVATTLRESPKIRLGMHAGIAACEAVGEFVRRDRLTTNIEEAARTGNGIQKGDWQRMPPQEQRKLIDETKLMSLTVTIFQALTTVANLGLSAAAVVSDNPALNDAATNALAGEVRNLIYMFMRDYGNGKFCTTRVVPPPGGETAPTNERNLRLSAVLYGLATAAGTGATQIPSTFINNAQGVSTHGLIRTATDGSQLSVRQLVANLAATTTVAGAANSCVEIFEAFLQNTLQARQAGGQQEAVLIWKNDALRVLDHGQLRILWNRYGTMAGMLLTVAMYGRNVSQPDQIASNAASQGLAFGLTYIMINFLYQAHAGVRSAEAAASRASEVERGGSRE
jgi:hypothetical protein